MGAIFIITQVFVILAISVHIGYSRAVEDEPEGATVSVENAKGIYQGIGVDINDLIQKLNDVSVQLQKRKLTLPNPIPDPEDFINKITDIISLKKSLNEVEDINTYRRCKNFLAQKIDTYILEQGQAVENDFFELLSVLQQKLLKTRQVVDHVAKDLRENQQTHRGNCEKDSQKCDETREVRDSARFVVESIKTQLDQLDQSFKADYETWTESDVTEKIVPAVRDCMAGKDLNDEDQNENDDVDF